MLEVENTAWSSHWRLNLLHIMKIWNVARIKIHVHLCEFGYHKWIDKWEANLWFPNVFSGNKYVEMATTSHQMSLFTYITDGDLFSSLRRKMIPTPSSTMIIWWWLHGACLLLEQKPHHPP
jgi:hypothetical protein